MKTMNTNGGKVKIGVAAPSKPKTLAPRGPGSAAKTKMGIHPSRMIESKYCK